MFDVVLLMAGTGNRTNLQYNKVFYEINNKPIYQYSLETLLRIDEINKIILVVHPEEILLVKDLETSKVIITTGGLTRQDSVYNGVRIAKEDIVLIHDGARCNVQKEDIIKVYQATKIHKAAVLAVKAKNTIKVVESGFVRVTLDRSSLWEMQTPQGLNRLDLIKGLEMAKAENYIGYDDVEIVEKYLGIYAKIVEGHDSNIKVTTAPDLKIMEVLLKEGL
jgi:2-C-methyl-D-erythritol 4-phosphate cytidylyltransferase